MNKYNELTERCACSRCGRMLDRRDREYHIKRCGGDKAFQKSLRSKIVRIIGKVEREFRGNATQEDVWRDRITEAIMDKTKMRPGFAFVVKTHADMLGQLHVCVDIAGMSGDVEYLCCSLLDAPVPNVWFNNGSRV